MSRAFAFMHGELARGSIGGCHARALFCAYALIASTIAAAQQHEEHTGPAGASDQSMPAMRGLYGEYSMAREASGTAWQPDSASMQMKHLQRGSWDLMVMGFGNAVYSDSETRGRGDEEVFLESMGMLTARREARGGTVGLRAMLSLDPLLVGDDGYPLLLQTGETADGRTPLIDRQHSHDLFMELSGSYAKSLGADSSVFVYGGLAGEPALGPVTYMHRVSGMDNPEAPLAHHWFDSTHISFGVLTAGIVFGETKFEASVFNGREPDESRYNIETNGFDSWSLRASWNPSANWATQVSFGDLDEPEQLEPGVDIARTTASATYHRPLADGYWQTTFAIGRNAKSPGQNTDAYLLESALRWSRDTTVFARAETVEKDELFLDGDPLHGQVFTVRKLGIGAVRDLRMIHGGSVGVGVVYNVNFVPSDLEPVYGDDPGSWLVFARWRVQ